MKEREKGLPCTALYWRLPCTAQSELLVFRSARDVLRIFYSPFFGGHIKLSVT